MRVGRVGGFAGWAAVTIIATASCAGTVTPGPSGGSPAGGAAPSPAGAVPSVAPAGIGVDCTRTGTNLGANVVAAQPDGVHFEVRNSSGQQRTFEVEGVGGGDAPTTATAVAWIVAPGPARVRCNPLDSGADAAWESLTIVDPAGVYVPDRVTCQGTISTANIDYASTAEGEQGDPVDIAQRQLRGLHTGDVVERAGYPETDARKVRVVRADEIVMVITFERSLRGGWLRSVVDSCSNVDLTWAS